MNTPHVPPAETSSVDVAWLDVMSTCIAPCSDAGCAATAPPFACGVSRKVGWCTASLVEDEMGKTPSGGAAWPNAPVAPVRHTNVSIGKEHCNQNAQNSKYVH